MSEKKYEVVHGFGHEGVYYTRDNQHEIGGSVEAGVIATLVQQKIIRELPAVPAGGTLDAQHAALRSAPAAKEYRGAVESSLEARGLVGIAEATEEVARAAESPLPGKTPATGAGAVEAARSTTRRGGK